MTDRLGGQVLTAGVDRASQRLRSFGTTKKSTTARTTMIRIHFMHRPYRRSGRTPAHPHGCPGVRPRTYDFFGCRSALMSTGPVELPLRTRNVYSPPWTRLLVLRL